ncbi:hypothetical protein Bhyg_05635 [Pseudolycoriella hygida]|uniref:Odorant receptor n=1 Tax=Pseudolycoriella hygida TaxID=35572 RepID=A0A9Q0MZA4_9DIPT|nr:hypothetical protein Bhyg_05635 [Pseudolycoriella hygida]
MFRISFFYLCLTVSIFTTTVIIVPIVHLLCGNHDPTTWVQVYDAFIFPFEKDSYLTFFGKNLTVFITTLCYYTAIASFMLILMSTCVCYESCIDDMLDDFRLIDEANSSNNAKSSSRLDIGRTLVGAVKYQNIVNEHLTAIGRIISGVLFVSILNAITTMALALFYIEEELLDMSAHFVTSFDILLIQAITCLIYCYFGNRITSKSVQISNNAYFMEWHRLPMSQQMIVKLIILRSQREIYFSGWSIIRCSLEMYKKAIFLKWNHFWLVLPLKKQRSPESKNRKNVKPTRPIEIGELVLISNENQKRTLWPIAKVIEIHRSADGIIRVVTLRTKNGELQRPVKKLIPLEIRSGEDVSIMGIPEIQRKDIEALEVEKVKKPSKSKISTKDSELVEIIAPLKQTRSGRTVKPVDRFVNYPH